MKFPRLLLVAVLFSSTGCERVRQLVGNSLDKGKVTTAAAVPLEPLVTDISDLDSFSIQRGKLVIIEYHAVWNGRSQQLAPLLKEITVENGGKVVVGRIDVDRFRQIATREGVATTPDIRIYRDGRFVEKYVGLPDNEELRAKVAKYVVGLPTPAVLGKASPAGKPLTQPMRKDWMPEGVRRR
ncbi:MAG: thioredoxin [Verrucomicrobiaceae bacterium]|nr:MAG: thioredoxin [Verrucomicrobiaceae bacterium]